MKNNQYFYLVLILLINSFLFCSCSIIDLNPVHPPISPRAPDWVLKGNGVFDDENVIYGVGSASGMDNVSRQRVKSEDMAREDLLKVLGISIKSKSKSNISSKSVDFSENQNEKIYFEQTLEAYTQSVISGIEVIDHWEHPSRNETFSLVQLDIEKWKKRSMEFKNVSKDVKENIRKKYKEIKRVMENRNSVKMDTSDRSNEGILFDWKTFKKWFQYGAVATTLILGSE